MLSRRNLLRNLGIGAGIVGIVYACSDDEEEIEVQKNALELQQAEGWNIGSDERSLALSDTQSTDSTGSSAWQQYANPQTLLSVYQPTNPALKPYFVPTLIQALAQQSLHDAIKPVCSSAMREAYSRGLGMKALLADTNNAQSTALVVDINGPEAVAFAAALSDVVQPVLTFDNWPHPLGVVPSQQTLGALIYFAAECAQKNSARPTNAPALYVLDAARLAAYTDADNQFDNRYIAKLPTAENLKALNVSSVLYTVSSEQQQHELDDINDDFATFREQNINVSLLSLSRFTPATQDSTSTTLASTTATNANAAIAQTQQQYNGGTGYAHYPVYYYGGNPFLSPWFFYHYAMFSYSRPLPSPSRLPASSFSPPSYQPTRRPTMFSAGIVGGRTGIGKQRPSGFGSVGVRVGATSGIISGVRAGRAGSFGGSRGFRSGSFGRSFGGRSS